MNKKKLLALLMALVMTLTLVPVTALADEPVRFPEADITIMDAAQIAATDENYTEEAVTYLMTHLGDIANYSLTGVGSWFLRATKPSNKVESFLFWSNSPTTSTEKAFVFSAKDIEGEVFNTYQDWLCDFVVSYDEDVAADSVILSGYYNNMIAAILMGLDFDGDNVTKQPLISSVGYAFNYYAIVNEVSPFLCTAINIAPENIGKTINVSLVMWPNGEELTEENAHIVATIPYKFTAENLSTMTVDGIEYHYVSEGFSEGGKVFNIYNEFVDQTEAGPHFAPAYVAQVGETYYTNLQEAISAAFIGGTVEVLKDVTVEYWHQNIWSYNDESKLELSTDAPNYVRSPLDGPNGLTINGNGHTVTIKNIDSGSNGDSIFARAENTTINHITFDIQATVAGEQAGKYGIGMKSGVLNDVTIQTVHGAPLSIYCNCANTSDYSNVPGVTVTDCVLDAGDGGPIYTWENSPYYANLIVRNSTLKSTLEGTILILRSNDVIENCKIDSPSGSKITLTNDGIGLPATITGNDFGDAGLKVYSTNHAAEATITSNVFSSTSVIKRAGEETVDLSGNYWGGSEPSFSEDKYVTYNSWYTGTQARVSATGAERAVTNLVSNAAANVARIDDVEFETLQAAFNAAKNGDTIELLGNLNIVGNNAEAALAGKAVTLDLGGYTLTGRINLRSGALTVQNGTMTHTENGQRAIDVYGTDDASYNTSNNVYTKLVVANNVTISGGSYGIVVAGKTLTDKYAYGVVVEMNGAINGTNDGIFVMGNIGDNEASGNAMKADAVAPKITVNGSINTNGLGIQMSGASEVTVNGSVTAPTAIGVKRGHLTVANSAIIHATGEKVDPVLANNNGTEQSGAAISVTSTYNYAGDIRVDVNGGTITSENNAALYVGHANKNNKAVAFVKGAAISVSDGNFKGGADTAAVFVADAISGDATMPAGFITGGKYSAEPDSSYVASGYKAAKISDTNYPYQVGVATITPTIDGSIEGETPAAQVTYTVSTTVKETEQSETPLETVTDMSVTVVGTTTETTETNGSGVAVAALTNIKNDETLSAIVADAIEAAGTKISEDTTSASIVIQVAKSAADKSVANKVTYEVHPEAVISTFVNEVPTGVATVALDNDQIKGTFSFTLDVTGTFNAGVSVYVKNTHANGTSDVYGPLEVKTVDDRQVVEVTGVTRFSEVEITPATSGAVAFDGASLRRRVKTVGGIKTDEVVNTSTDIRFTYTWSLPTGANGLHATESSYFMWRKSSNEEWQTVAISNVSGNSASLVINGVPNTAFDVDIQTKVHLVFDNNTYLESESTSRSVTFVAQGLASNSNAPDKWKDYGLHLQKLLSREYHLSFYDESLNG